MYKDHMKPLTWYRNAVNRLKNGLHSNGSPPDIRSARSNGPIPSDVDYSATAAHCEGRLHPTVLCRESQFMIRKIKEALYIKHNSNINRDNGTAVSESWTNIIQATNC
ncbi:hypothetical protein M513_07410 [Trichuris suis]|uniref:Uncharacterized protein n=1 Tax=Trichuris suis TaxID=68888 RepID=A0A085M3B8_9BILA|nr:hypothetical protein M513_07410 [Trichuris suis]